MTAKYIHYGSLIFNKALFRPITNNNYFNKPDGGLWASPVISDFGWKEWCESNSFRLDKLLEHFVFALKPDANVLVIQSNTALTMLDFMGYCIDYSKKYDLPLRPDEYYLDFEKLLSDGYDAVQVFINNETYWSMYGWDCDSILILNPDCIILD